MKYFDNFNRTQLHTLFSATVTLTKLFNLTKPDGTIEHDYDKAYFQNISVVTDPMRVMNARISVKLQHVQSNIFLTPSHIYFSCLYNIRFFYYLHDN